MTLRLLPLHEQVMVITGASSGIGLVTAKLAALRGARVVLTARNARDLHRAVAEIRQQGGRAVHLVGDVADATHVARVADVALAEFGQLDTWVNNAAVSLYGRIAELSLDDMRRQMDVNYWGQVYGSRTAARHLRARGGALINVGSALCDRAIPLQANYSAAKHALKGFTDALRMELEGRRAHLGDAGQTGKCRHAVVSKGKDVSWRGAAASAAGVRTGGRGRRHSARGAVSHS